MCVAKPNVGKNAIIIDFLQIAIQQYNAMFDRYKVCARERERDARRGMGRNKIVVRVSEKCSCDFHMMTWIDRDSR